MSRIEDDAAKDALLEDCRTLLRDVRPHLTWATVRELHRPIPDVIGEIDELIGPEEEDGA